MTYCDVNFYSGLGIFGKQPRRKKDLWQTAPQRKCMNIYDMNRFQGGRARKHPALQDFASGARTERSCCYWLELPALMVTFSNSLVFRIDLSTSRPLWKANYCLHLKEGDILCDVRELNPADRISKGWGSRPNAERRTPLGQACVHRSARFCGYRVCCFSFQSNLMFDRGTT